MDNRPENLKEGCLMVLRYFGIFRYPLTAKEIHHFNPVRATEQQTRAALEEMKDDGLLYRNGIYFMTGINESWVKDRRKGNEKARYQLKRSGRYVRIIASFPFVRGIAISGSLSKFYASDQTDIDYFIITEAHRLWIARSLLHLFKKLTFITGHQHYFCMNYFVDTLSLKITHPNEYTSIEMATLLPAYNLPLLKLFLNDNTWINDYLPNHPGMKNMDYVIKSSKQSVKIFLEKIIELFSPDKLNYGLMNLTDKKWRRKWKRAGYPENEYNRAFLTNLHISKNPPVDYEKKVLKELSMYQPQSQHNV